jgi:pimeloyl-ACP methyl ester carboxylesterase
MVAPVRDGRVTVGDVTLAYDVVGTGDPVVLLNGCGAPAVAWHLSVVPHLVGAGYQVVTFDFRGVAPSSSPPAPYSVAQLAADTLGLLDHLEITRARMAGYSMGGWVAETLAVEHPGRVQGAVFIGSCNRPTSWEKAITTVERDLARDEPQLPRLFFALETLRYLPNKDLQEDTIVDAWLAMIGDLPVWENPGRLGQYEACLAWSTDSERSWWDRITVPCLLLGFEHDVDSPPQRARQAAAAIAGSRLVEIAGASHLGVFTHADEVCRVLVDFFAEL